MTLYETVRLVPIMYILMENTFKDDKLSYLEFLELLRRIFMNI